STLRLPVLGRAGVPKDATGVIVNVTVVAPTGAGHAAVYPCGSRLPLASTLNFAAGETVSNTAVAEIREAGSICIFTSATAHLVAAVSGYTGAIPPASPPTPTSSPTPVGGPPTELTPATSSPPANGHMPESTESTSDRWWTRWSTVSQQPTATTQPPATTIAV